MIAVDGSDGLVMGSGIRCGCPVLLKSFPDICDGAIAGVRILVKSGLINLGPHVPWPQINQAGNVGTLHQQTLILAVANCSKHTKSGSVV